MLGAFYLVYAAAQILSTGLALRVGIHRWLALTLICTGVVAMAMCGVESFVALFMLRLTLGMLEGGLVPISCHFILCTVRKHDLGVSCFSAIAPLSGALSGLLTTAMLEGLDGLWGWDGWRWTFLLQGACTVAAGCALALFLPELNHGDTTSDLVSSHFRTCQCRSILRSLLVKSETWWMVMLVFSCNVPLVAVNSWAPDIVRTRQYPNVLFNVTNVLPYVTAVAALLLFGWHRHTAANGCRYSSRAVLCGIGCIALASFCLSSRLELLFVLAISAAIGCLFTWTPGVVGWAHHVWKERAKAAIGLALLYTTNSIANAFGPVVVGYLMPLGDSLALLILSALPFAGAASFHVWASPQDEAEEPLASSEVGLAMQ